MNKHTRKYLAEIVKDDFNELFALTVKIGRLSDALREDEPMTAIQLDKAYELLVKAQLRVDTAQMQLRD